jgi:hypothetical protein
MIVHLDPRALLALAASIVIGCGGGAVAPAHAVPAGAVPAPNTPGSGDDGLCIAEAAWEPGALPEVPRLTAAKLGAPSHLDAAPGAPTTAMVIDGERLGHDPGVAVGDRYLMVYTAHQYRLYDKATGKLLEREDGDEVAAVGSFNTLFSPLWAPRDRKGAPNAANVNRHLRFAEGDPIPCDPDDPLSDASRACVREFYDSRVVWDPMHKRFWIESAARNHLWFCTPSATEPCTDPKWSRTQPRRFIAVAVSRTDDPRKGFHRYILVDEYADWPKMAVQDRYLVLGHMSSSNVYVFDADKLADGNPGHGPVRLAKLDASSAPGWRYINPVTHHGPTGDVTFLVGTDGTDKLTVFGLLNPDPTRAAKPVVVRGPPVSLGRKLGSFTNNAVFRDGKLYLSWDECAPGAVRCAPRRVRAVRVPARRDGGNSALVVSTDPAQGFLDVTIGGRDAGDPPDDTYDYQKPVMDVTAQGDMVIGYARRGLQTRAEVSFEPRYSIVYHGETTARPGVSVRRGTWREAPDVDDNGKAGIDLAGAQTDPSDDRTVWISHVLADEEIHWFRQITMAVRP